MKQVTNQTRTMAQSSSGNIKKVATEMKVLANETKNTTAQQELLIKKINDMKADLSTLSSFELKGNVGQQLRADIEKAENQLLSLQGKTKTTGSVIDNYFKNGLKSVKRFVLGLVSVGSVYALISRGIQSYLATNEEAQRKYELTSNTIGAMLAPAMEKLLDIIQYIVIGMALLIQMFTGFNALAKVTTKNISNATKESKKLNKELTAMDEITNLSDPDAGNIDLSSDYSALADFQSKIAEVQALFDKWEIQKVVDKIKDLSKWLWDNKEAVIAVGLAFGTVFALSKIGEIVGNISTLIGVAGTGKMAATGAKGLAGITGMLTGIATFGLIVIDILIWAEVFKQFKILKETVDEAGGWGKSIAIVWGYYFEQIGNTIENLIKKIKEFLGLYSTVSKAASSGGGYVGGGGRAFATGGVVTKPTYSLTGEYQNAKNDPEIISPQSMMRDTMLDAFSQILPSMQGNGNGGGDAILVVNGKELARATFQDYQNEGLRVGTSTLIRRS